MTALGLLCGSPAEAQSRTELYQALHNSATLDPDRQLVHLSHACTLKIDGASFPVVDLQEIVRGVSTPRGVNRIVILDANLKPIKTIGYSTERPLFCIDNRLYVFGDITIGNTLPEGNVLTFSNKGQQVAVSHVEANDYPIAPTRNRKGPPQ
ncbi:MAG: hypothetical protein ABSH49_30885 [Bryobacteraceae bacterium]